MAKIEIPRPVSSPKKALPPQSWDCHAHVFGPYDRYPLLPGRLYDPPLAPQGGYLAMLDKAGFAHGVLVHASANGWDNATTSDAVQAGWPRLRGIAVLPVDVDDAELERHDRAGIRGLRFTEHARAFSGPGRLVMKDMRAFASRLRALSWHIQVFATQALILDYFAEMKAMDLPVIFDHMGSCEVDKGVGHPDFQRFLAMMKDSDFWIKLTPGRVSREYPSYDKVRPFHDACVEAFPDRLVFGSDWPFIGDDAILPDVGRLIDLFDAWTPDPAIRHKIFVDNPRRFFGAR